MHMLRIPDIREMAFHAYAYKTQGVTGLCACRQITVGAHLV